METSLANFTHCASDGTLQVSQTSVELTDIWSHLGSNISETSSASVSGDLGRGGVVVPGSGRTARHNPFLAVVRVQFASVQAPHVSTVTAIIQSSISAGRAYWPTSCRAGSRRSSSLSLLPAPSWRRRSRSCPRCGNRSWSFWWSSVGVSASWLLMYLSCGDNISDFLFLLSKNSLAV